MIVEVTVSNIVVDQAAVTHGSKHVSTGTDPIPLGTTSAAGVVQLATTGVEEATKVPKATGADLAALLTAGGYTLTAPSGANSLDGIADTATWKKVAAAVATALNAGTYDAASVSAFGIGGRAANMSVSLNNYTAGGFFRDNGTLTNSPFAPSEAQVLVLSSDTTTYCTQIAIKTVTAATPQIKIRVQYGGAWSAWKDIWNSDSDGNGGRPPAPKPKAYSSAGIGELYSIDAAENTAISLPNPSGGSTWAYWVATIDSSTGAVTHFNGASGIAGGTEIRAARGAGTINRLVAWRTA